MKKKTDPRHLSRQVALQTLFEWNMHTSDPHEIAHRLIKEELPDQKIDLALLTQIIDLVIEHKDTIDHHIEVAAPAWPLNQLAKIDLTILRIAIAELAYVDSIPEKVTIDEAVEISKEYSTDTSSKFINGVLGTVLKNINKGNA